MASVSLFLLAAVLVNSASAVIFDRECRGVRMVQDFDLRRYARNWYEIRRYETSTQWNGDCSTFNYELDFALENPYELQVQHRFAFRNNGTIVTRPGILTQRHDHHHHPSNVGHLMMIFDDQPDTAINYCLVASDYENFAVIWSCYNLGDGRSNEDAWILSKDPVLDPQFNAAVQEAIDLELNESYLTDTYQGASCQAIGPY